MFAVTSFLVDHIVCNQHDCSMSENARSMKNYFVTQYGAIKTINFSLVFESIIAEEKKDGWGSNM